MSVFSTIKNWLKKTFGGGSSSSSSARRARTVSNYGGGGSRSYSSTSMYLPKEPIESKQQRMEREAKERKAKQDATTKALASTIDKKAKDAESKLNTTTANVTSGVDRAIRKMGERAKSAPPDPKLAQAQKSREDATKALRSLEKVASKATTKPERRMTGTIEGAKIEAERHPVATMAARKAVNGALFGAPDLVGKLSAKGDAKELEETYRRTAEEHPWIAGGSEIAGSLVGFGLTGGLSKAVAGNALNKVGGKEAAERLFENQVAKLAGSEVVKKTARREAMMAARQGAIRAVDEEVVKKFALDRARRILNGVAEDMAINATTGLVYDLSSSATDSNSVGDFVKNMAINAGMNAVVGGLQPIGGALLRTNRGALDAAGRIFADEAGDAVARNADEVIERAAVNAVEDNADDVVRTVEPPVMAEEVPPPPMREEPKVQKKAYGKQKSGAVQNNIVNEELNGELARANDQIDRIRNEILEKRGTASEEELDKLNRKFEKAVAKRKSIERKIEKASKQAEKERNLKRLNDLLEKQDRQTSQYKSGDRKALEDLIATEDELRQAYRDAGMSRSDSYRESKKLFDAHKKELKELNKTTRVNAEVRNEPRVSAEVKISDEVAKTIDDIDLNKPLSDADKDVIRSRMSELEARRKQLEIAGREGDEEWLEAGAERSRLQRALDRDGKAPEFGEVEATKEKADPLGTYKKNVKADVENAKTEPANTVEVDGKKLAAVEESPFETKPEPKREKPKFTTDEQKAKKLKNSRKKVEDEKLKKLAEQKRKFRRNPVPRGEGLHKGVYKQVTGKELDEVIKPPTFEDVLEAQRTHARGQASHDKEVVSRAGTSFMNATTEEAQREFLKEGWKDGNFTYFRIKNSEKYADVMRRWVDEPEAVARELMKYNNDLSTLPADRIVDTHYQAWCVTKMLRSQLDNKELSEAELAAVREVYSSAASLSQKLSSMSGQVNQFQGVMVYCTPEKRMQNAVDNIVDLLDSSRGFRKHTRIKEGGKTMKLDGNMAKRKQQIRSLVLDDEGITKALNKVFDAATEEEYGTAMEELMLSAYRLNKATSFDYLQQWRYLSMLGNPKTHARNFIGNVTFGGIRQISNMVRSITENSLEGWAAKRGLELEMHGGLSPKALMQAQSKKLAFDDAGKKAWEVFEKNKKNILGANKYDTPEMVGFFKALSEGNSKLLAIEDDIFRGRSFREQYIKSYNKYLRKKIPITEELEKRMYEEALRESRVATFNEANELARLLSQSQRWMYDANASFGKKAVGRFSNALLPFTKVPANILNQSVNYSPAGVARGLAHIVDAASSGNSVLLNQAIDEFSSGLTGSAIAAAGYFLGKHTDAFTTNAGSEDKAAQFKKRQGVQNYSVTFKGKDGKTRSYTLDWMVPASSTFFMGVEFANQFKNGFGGANFLDALGNISQVTSRVIDPVLETSMLSSIYNIVENSRKSSSYDDQKSFADIVMRETVQSYLSSFVPTLQGQIARTAYGEEKMVTGENDWEYWVNSMKVKMGLANTDILYDALGADTDAYGEVKKSKSFLENAVLPTNIQEVDLTETDKAKIKEYEDYVAAGGDPADKAYLFPTKQYRKSFTYGKDGAEPVDVKMTNKQVSLYNQAKTTGGAEGMRVALEGQMFNRYDKDSNGKRTILKDGYTAEEKKKLIKQFEGKSLREVEEWLYKQPQFKSATEEERRRVLNALWSYSSQGKSQGAKRVGEQAVVVDQGGDINEYNFKNEVTKAKQIALKDAIDAGILTYEEIVDFARNAGKTYYYENDEGGSANTYYNKKEMIAYLESKGYSYEKAEALYNAFKTSNAKEYGASSSRSGRRRYGGYRRRGRGGRSSKKAKVPTPKTIKASQLVKGEALVSKKSSSSAKATLPQLKRVEAKIDLPTKKKR